MYSFRNDYSDGAHPKILQEMLRLNEVQTEGYGEDRFSQKAAELIRKQLGKADADIHFITGGTLTNQVAISAFLRPHEAVISAHSGHIYVHETGAIETTGHKVIPVDSEDGKLTPAQIEAVAAEHHFEHMVKPRLVYISQPTENGTLYSADEMTALRETCDKLDLLLYADGARLGSALASDACSLELSDYARLCDAFYIGGTKNGALLGEALVICNDSLKPDFRYHLKQKGALSAKGRVLGIQFMTLFTDNLYIQLAQHANRMADRLQKGIRAAGYELKFRSDTNQIFPILPDALIKKLEDKYLFYCWEQFDEAHSVVRLVCSWATDEQMVDKFIKDLSALNR